MDIAAWLNHLGLGQYEQAFRENDVEAEVLPELTAEDLIGLGVTSIGHRRKLLAAIAALRETPPPAGETLAPITTPAPEEAPSGVASSSAERRQLTVMFSDLVGSTALSARLDPEDLREVIAAYHRAVAEIVTRLGGFVSRFMGDGLLVYFGYPQAHEDDAERAVRAGLDAIDAVRLLDVKSIKLQTRVGIATGLVVVGDLVGAGSAQEQAVVGETPNLAARLQNLAEPDAVVIGAGTRRLLGNLFEYRDLGMVEVKGIAAPVPAWQVLRPSIVASRFEALHGSALSPLIGRDEEIGLLLRRWTHARAGAGQVVLISGEPGIGKSRLTVELEERLKAEPHLHLRYFCSPYHQDSALYPFVVQLERAARFGRDDGLEQKLVKLRATLAPTARDDDEIELLAELLSLPSAAAEFNLTPQRKREKLLEALIYQIEALALSRPVLMVFEDAHWIDPTSRELLDFTVERVRRLPMLLIVAFRPEFQPPWTGQPHVTMLALNRLDQWGRIALVGQIAGGKALPGEVVEQIAERTDGVPLFVEELTKSVLESGLLREEADRHVLDRALPTFAIPTSLHDSLMARLDRLASVRWVAQIGAAIGREFSYALIRAVSHLPEDELRAALDRLVASELVFQRSTSADAVYAFKHALVQDAAHDSLLRSTRQQLHAKIAETIETHFPEMMDIQPELLAQHYAEAGLVEESAVYWGRAGHRSATRSAMAEAAAQYQQGLDQLALLPDTSKRQRQELEFWSALGAVLMAARGQASPEAGHAYTRARELWEQLGSPSEFLHVFHRQSIYHMYRGEFDLSVRLNEDLLRLSRQRNDSFGLVLGHYSSGLFLAYHGDFVSSRSSLEELLALYEPISHRSLVQRTGFHLPVISRAILGIVLYCLGFPDQALAQSNAAIVAAQRLAHPQSLAIALVWGSRLLLLIGDNAAAKERVDQLAAVTAEQGFSAWGAQGMIYRGWIKVKNGDVTEGMRLLRSSSAAYCAAGAAILVPYIDGLMASAYEIAGQIEEALAQLAKTFQVIARTREHWFEAELHRRKGHLLLRSGQFAAAEERYRKALGIAREQQAKIWELRAVVSLARLRRDQGRHAEARDLLVPVHGWFTEGFDTPDLKEAKVLLEELG